MIATITIIVFLPIVVVSVGLMIRNSAVYAFRTALNAEIHRLNVEEIDGVLRPARQENPWEWRREEYNTVSYNTMVWQFWRPFKSFFREGFPKASVASDG